LWHQKDGSSIIATIIITTTYMPSNDAAAPGRVCPGIRILPIADMDAHQTIVIAALAAKSSAETPKKARWEARSETQSLKQTMSLFEFLFLSEQTRFCHCSRPSSSP
jgi:hypothetical protein